MQAKAMLTIAYTRVSTQAQKDGQGLQQQRSAIASYAAMRKVEIDDWFSDAATGTSDTRPELDRLKLMVEAGQVGRVLVDRIDRLGRTTAVAATLCDFFREHGVELVSVKEFFGEPGTPMYDLMQTIMVGIAQFDRATMLGRMRASKREALKQGRFVGGPVPFGYTTGREPGRLEIDRLAAGVVRRIFELRKLGLSSVVIANMLNAEGHASPHGGAWHNTSVLNIAKRADFYKGLATMHRCTGGALPIHEAIL